MVEYTTIKAEEIKYGTYNFIEVARKEIDGNEFISLSKGYFTPDGTRRYKTGLGFPDEGGIAQFLAKAVLDMSEGESEMPTPDEIETQTTQTVKSTEEKASPAKAGEELAPPTTETPKRPKATPVQPKSPTVESNVPPAETGSDDLIEEMPALEGEAKKPKKKKTA
jgi:hypothetical protein